MPEPSAVFAPDLLKGRVILVTGGGTNLGKAATAELLAAGADVVIAGRREEVLQETSAELGCSYVVGDIRAPESARDIVLGAKAVHGRVDVLVNNAGGQYYVPAEDIVPKGWNAVLRLNVGGTLNMMEAAVAHGFGDEGQIVNVTVSPHHGMPAMAHTGAARAAVEQLGREAAERWRAQRVTTSALAVGRVATESLKKYPAVVQKDLAGSVPAQRLGTLQEFGHAITLLSSPLGRAFNGGVLTLDGGLDNWNGPWPTNQWAEDDGHVPTETRVSHAPRG